MRFALSMGDPAGIGPEITLKASVNRSFRDAIVVTGSYSILKRIAETLSSDLPIVKVTDDLKTVEGAINVLESDPLAPDDFCMGKPQACCGRAAFSYVDHAIELALEKKVRGVITNPISKEALAMAGIHYPGHTEIFAEKTGVKEYSMMFLLGNVGVTHVTTHCSLRRALELLTEDKVLVNIRLLDRALTMLGVAHPRIAVAGLNPHAGENGLFGDEEIVVINPAIAAARSEGINATGSFPPDTVFMRAFKGEFDGVVSMLHDHGFVALKSMDFNHGVNITIGLPIIRTSVGHGTAFSIAGKNVASSTSLIAAFTAAERLDLQKGI